MKKFAFSLQRILSFKKTMYEKERNLLAQLRAERTTLEQRRMDVEQQMYEQDAKFRQKAATEGVGLQEVNKNSLYRESAKLLMDQLDIEIDQLEIKIERQLTIVVELDKEVQSLEKLRERQWEEYLADAAREEQERILEMVSRKHFEAQQEEREEEYLELKKQETAKYAG